MITTTPIDKTEYNGGWQFLYKLKMSLDILLKKKWKNI